MVGLTYIKELVDSYQVPNTSLAIKHYDDMVYCSMVLFNEIVRKLHNTHKGKRTFVDIVLNMSIEDTTLMRELIKHDESFYMADMMEFYYEHEMQYRIPCVCKDVKVFRDRRASKPKDTAIEIVTKMYEIYCQDKLTEDEIAQVVATKNGRLEQKRARKAVKLELNHEADRVKAVKLMGKREQNRIAFEKIQEK